jgi:ankyrin repeat protein
MKSVLFKPLIIINLLFFFNTQNYGSEKPSSSFFANKAHITYEALEVSISSILYLLNYIFHITWYKFFTPTEKELYEAILHRNSIATHIILAYPNIDPNYISHAHYCYDVYDSLLHIACSCDDFQTVKKLLSFDQINPNILDNDNNTPLAITYYTDTYGKSNKLKIIKELIKHPKTNVNHQTNTFEGNTVLEWACKKGYTNIVKLLLNRKDIDTTKCRYHTYLGIARYSGNKTIFDMLCDHPQANHLEMFTIAIEDDNVELIAKLLKNNSFRANALKYWDEAYKKNYSKKKANQEIIKMLIENIEKHHYEGTTYYHTWSNIIFFLACWHGYTDIVKLLLTRNAININNKYSNYEYIQKTCLYITNTKKYTDIFEILSNHPEIDPVDLFAIAVENNDVKIVKKLLKAHPLSALESPNTDSLQKAVKNENMEIFKLILEAQPAQTACNIALYEAIGHHNKTFVELLLKVPNLNIHQKNYACEPPFFLAIELDNIFIAQLLYNHTNNIVNEYYNDETPLTFAIRQKKNKNMINFLIDICNANLSLKDINNVTFFHLLAIADPALNLEELTFFKNYNNTQKKQFINEQLKAFVYIKFSDDAANYIHRTVYSFINYCKKYGGDFNQKSKYDRPIYTAYKTYKALDKYTSHDSAQFIIKEKIYHAFLNHTNAIPEHELHYRLKNIFGVDIKNNIMQYYYAVTIDQKIASLMLTNHNQNTTYYKKNAIEKIAFKKQTLNDIYKQFGYALIS